MALGYIAAHYAGVERKNLATLLLFFLSPAVMFGLIAQAEIRPAFALLPVIGFVLPSVLTLGFFAVARRIYADNRANLLALCAGTTNTGYFGLPVMMVLFTPYWVSVYALILLGWTFYESIVLYYIAVRGHCTVRESVYKLIRFPAIYAALAGLAVSLMGWDLPPLVLDYWGKFRGAYIVISMMTLGAALPPLNALVFAPRFMAWAFLGKFVAWPLAVGALVGLDYFTINLFPPEIHRMLMVMSLLPPAVNATAFAVQLDLRPEKAATTVLVGTLLALIVLPLFIGNMGALPHGSVAP